MTLKLAAVVLLSAAGCAEPTVPQTPLGPPERGAPVGFTSNIPIADYKGQCHQGIWDSYRVYTGDCALGTCLVIGQGKCTLKPGAGPIACSDVSGVWMTTQNGYWQCAT